ncbi:beta-ketoacyl-[acyl-carrier-protein] synthase family protein [Acidothermaceae bacterium B102]|nr:beta-ketoacyl-[acyl-carrier-protein] synthase family protein [Acidothermaceae bacterium B102]
MTQDQVRVVITGLGATTPVGGDVASTWEGLLAGRSGVTLLEPDWSQLPVRLAAPVAVDPSEVLDRIEARTLDRIQQLALIAAREAWADAGSPEVDPDRFTVVCATGIGGVGTIYGQYDVLREKGARRVSPHTIQMLMPNGSAATISLKLGARGGAHTPVSACASGSEALSWAIDLIRLGRADVVVAGGAEACIHPLPMSAFASMRALSTREDDPGAASRPYDKGRDGFVLGEGAGLLVLESEEHALARGAYIYAELAGAGVTADSYHMAAPDPSGQGAVRAMRTAMKEAGVVAADIVHINAHATSTPAGDIAEATAIMEVLGDATAGAAVTATKSMTGHMLGAAGAVEAIATVLAIRDGIAPAIRNLDEPDDEISLDLIRHDNRKIDFTGKAALSNSFGFGGANAAVVIKPYPSERTSA